MKRQKLMLFSGFLGSGKTTAMVKMAKYLENEGIKTALITNDLGENLVDTNYAKLNKVPVREIPNGCLCHDVPGFVSVVKKIMDEEKPDYIFAEPVGSCVGLVQSVYMELDREHRTELELCPFVALIDPIRYRSIYLEPRNNTFNEEAVYMFGKQLSDADILLLNKSDLISESEKKEIEDSLKKNFPTGRVIAVTSVTGEGYREWADSFTKGQTSAMHAVAVDWDYLIRGDEHMGWFNSTLRFFAEKDSDFNLIIENLMSEIRFRFMNEELEIAHLKILGRTEKEYCKAALTGTGMPVSFSERFSEKAYTVLVTINMRALASPDKIAEIIHAGIESTRNLFGLRISEEKEQVFDSFGKAPEPKAICNSCSCGCEC